MGALKLEDLPRYCYEDYKNWDSNWELIYGVPYAISSAQKFGHAMAFRSKN